MKIIKISILCTFISMLIGVSSNLSAQYRYPNAAAAPTQRVYYKTQNAAAAPTQRVYYKTQDELDASKKCSSRGRRFGWGFLGGGATGGLIAGVAGSAKWTPLGIVAGGLVGGGIAAATAKNCDRKEIRKRRNR